MEVVGTGRNGDSYAASIGVGQSLAMPRIGAITGHRGRILSRGVRSLSVGPRSMLNVPTPPNVRAGYDLAIRAARSDRMALE